MEQFSRYLNEVQSTLERIPLDRSQRICDVLYRACEVDRTIFLFGNGGTMNDLLD